MDPLTGIPRGEPVGGVDRPEVSVTNLFDQADD